MNTAVITLAAPVAAAFPEAEIRLVVVSGLDNTEPWPEAGQVRAEAEAAVAAGTVSADPAVNESVASWQEAYRAFGTNPKRSRPSVDALLRRVTKSGVFWMMLGSPSLRLSLVIVTRTVLVNGSVFSSHACSSRRSALSAPGLAVSRASSTAAPCMRAIS